MVDATWQIKRLKWKLDATWQDRFQTVIIFFLPMRVGCDTAMQ